MVAPPGKLLKVLAQECTRLCGFIRRNHNLSSLRVWERVRPVLRCSAVKMTAPPGKLLSGERLTRPFSKMATKFSPISRPPFSQVTMTERHGKRYLSHHFRCPAQWIRSTLNTFL